MLTRKYYKLIAKVIKDSSTLDTYGDVIVHKDDLINDLCNELKQDNSAFNRDRFTSACNGD